MPYLGFPHQYCTRPGHGHTRKSTKSYLQPWIKSKQDLIAVKELWFRDRGKTTPDSPGRFCERGSSRKWECGGSNLVLIVQRQM